ncbi:MAG: energy transducer TonB [Burkholderiales bacterium]|nr:energy transducer TonB [Burkholderiales bacterium]
MMQAEKWMPAGTVVVLHALLIAALVMAIRPGPMTHPAAITEITLLHSDPAPEPPTVAPTALPMSKPALHEVSPLPVPDLPPIASQSAVREEAAPVAHPQASSNQATEPVAPREAVADAVDSEPHMDDASAAGNPKPVYPAASRKLGEVGTVMIRVYVLADGTVGEMHLAQSSGFGRLDAAALDAVRKWRFVPAMRAGQPIAMWYMQSVRFALNG